MLRFLICASLFIAVIFAEGYWDFEISHKTVCTVRFRAAYISVWEDRNNSGRYYASPLVDLNETTAEVISSPFTDSAQLRFDVVMWSLEAHEVVVLYLKNNINENVTEDHLELLPMYKIRLMWNSKVWKLGKTFMVDNEWKSNTRLAHVATFKIVCCNEKSCKKLQKEMMKNPAVFEDLEVHYVVNGVQPVSRKVTILGQHVKDGVLFSELVSMTGTISSERYLNSEDTNKLLSETTHNVIMSIETDEDYVHTGDELTIKELLDQHLLQKEVDSATFEAHMWDSVYWNPDWARPDKLTDYLNEILEKDESEQKMMVLKEGKRVEHREMSLGMSGSVGIRGIIDASTSRNLDLESTSENEKKIVVDTFTKNLTDNGYKVQYTGEFFRPKPMLLQRINLSRLTSSTRIATANIQLNKYQAYQKIRLRVTDTGSHTLMLTPQLLEKRLHDKVDEATKQLAITVNQAKIKLSQDVEVAKAELKIVRTDMDSLDRGTTYIRWGRTTCPGNGAEMVYQGYAAGGYFKDKGTGGELICLTNSPLFNTQSATKEQDTHAYIYGAEYQWPKSFFSHVNSPKKGDNALIDQDIPCVVCRTTTRPSKVMIPGRNECHGNGWTLEYWGYIMTSNWDQASLNYLCFDIAPEPIPGGHANKDGALVYIAQANCGSLKCPPYVQNYEITCAVCTK